MTAKPLCKSVRHRHRAIIIPTATAGASAPQRSHVGGFVRIGGASLEFTGRSAPGRRSHHPSRRTNFVCAPRIPAPLSTPFELRHPVVLHQNAGGRFRSTACKGWRDWGVVGRIAFLCCSANRVGAKRVLVLGRWSRRSVRWLRLRASSLARVYAVAALFGSSMPRMPPICCCCAGK